VVTVGYLGRPADRARTLCAAASAPRQPISAGDPSNGADDSFAAQRSQSRALLPAPSATAHKPRRP
jgi:hypothetical protein